MKINLIIRAEVPDETDPRVVIARVLTRDFARTLGGSVLNVFVPECEPGHAHNAAELVAALLEHNMSARVVLRTPGVGSGMPAHHGNRIDWELCRVMKDDAGLYPEPVVILMDYEQH